MLKKRWKQISRILTYSTIPMGRQKFNNTLHGAQEAAPLSSCDFLLVKNQPIKLTATSVLWFIGKAHVATLTTKVNVHGKQKIKKMERHLSHGGITRSLSSCLLPHGERTTLNKKLNYLILYYFMLYLFYYIIERIVNAKTIKKFDDSLCVYFQ